MDSFHHANIHQMAGGSNIDTAGAGGASNILFRLLWKCGTFFTGVVALAVGVLYVKVSPYYSYAMRIIQIIGIIYMHLHLSALTGVNNVIFICTCLMHISVFWLYSILYQFAARIPSIFSSHWRSPTPHRPKPTPVSFSLGA